MNSGQTLVARDATGQSELYAAIALDGAKKKTKVRPPRPAQHQNHIAVVLSPPPVFALTLAWVGHTGDATRHPRW